MYQYQDMWMMWSELYVVYTWNFNNLNHSPTMELHSEHVYFSFLPSHVQQPGIFLQTQSGRSDQAMGSWNDFLDEGQRWGSQLDDAVVIPIRNQDQSTPIHRQMNRNIQMPHIRPGNPPVTLLHPALEVDDTHATQLSVCQTYEIALVSKGDGVLQTDAWDDIDQNYLPDLFSIGCIFDYFAVPNAGCDHVPGACYR